MRSGLCVLAAVAIGGCTGGKDKCEVDATYDPAIVPSNFVSGVTSPLFPLPVGRTWTYSEGPQTVVVTVQSTSAKVILGVNVVQVRDTVTLGAETVEDTLDWYAQDLSGNVWYMGEDTKEYENGQVVSTEGSWEAGVDGAKPGLIVKANAAVGDIYRQEYYPCHAEDMGEITSLDSPVTVPYGSFTGCVQTHDFTPLEPDVNESKWYCPGFGVVLSVDNNTGEREELLTVTTSGSFAPY